MKLFPSKRIEMIAMNTRTTRFTLFPLFLAVALVPRFQLQAELAPAERLAPRDASVVVTVPDWESAATALRRTSFHRMLNDPAMKPLTDRIRLDFIRSIQGAIAEKDLKYFEEFAGLLKGQVTLIVGDARGILENLEVPPVTFVFDMKDQGGKLADFIDRSLKDEEKAHVVREKIAGGELISLIPAKETKTEDEEEKVSPTVFMAVVREILVAGFDRKSVEDILRRGQGGLADSLVDNPVFRADQARFLRGTKSWAWVNVAAMVKIAKDKAEPAKTEPANPFAMALDVGKILDAIGLSGWKSLAIGMDFDERGGKADLFLNLPEAERKGLFKLLATEKRPSAPPAFVPGDVAKYARWRKDGQEAIQTLERAVTEAVPTFAGFFSMMIDQAGKAKNPDFDFRRQFIGNLGNDIISLQWAPKAFTLNELGAPPLMYLIGSGNPAALLDALVTAQSSMGMPGMNMKEEEFLGQRLVSLPAGVAIGPDGQPAGTKYLHITTGRGYLVIGTDRERVEDFVRGGSKADSLGEIPGFRQAAESAGGLGTGWLVYQNPVNTLKMMITAVKNDPGAIEKLFGPAAFRTIFIAPGSMPGKEAEGKTMKEQIVEYVQLLPAFDTLVKYLNFSVSTMSTEREGILFRNFTPEPARR